ncbi:hypothetical protein ACFX1T_014784 [Malus domestica]
MLVSFHLISSIQPRDCQPPMFRLVCPYLIRVPTIVGHVPHQT